MHRNDHVYLVHGPRLYQFDHGDLDRPREVALPAVNGLFTQYNGMHVTEDGKLLVKGWAMDHHELGMMRPLILACLGAGLVLGMAVALALRLVLGALVGPLAVALAVLVGPAILAALIALATGTSWREFFRPRRAGHLLIIDPDTLEVVQRVNPPERCAYARTALVPAEAGAEIGRDDSDGRTPDEWLVIAGDERIMRWRYHHGELTYDSTWTERYRRWGDGSFPGTGPCVYRHVVYYTDNTFPVGLNKGYRLISQGARHV